MQICWRSGFSILIGLAYLHASLDGSANDLRKIDQLIFSTVCLQLVHCNDAKDSWK